MKLTMVTELGQFSFNLSQHSVIHLLNEAQNLDDSGELPEISAEEHTPAAKSHFDSMSVVIEHKENDPLLQVIEEVDKKLMEEIKKQKDQSSKKSQDEPSGFYTLKEAKGFPEIKRPGKNTKKSGTKDQKYKGFLYIRCDHCGKETGYHAKEYTDEFLCRECGKKTSLSGLRWANVDCKCGRHYTYRTNAKEEILTINCINCGSPVDMMLNTGRNAYVSILEKD